MLARGGERRCTANLDYGIQWGKGLRDWKSGMV